MMQGFLNIASIYQTSLFPRHSYSSFLHNDGRNNMSHSKSWFHEGDGCVNYGGIQVVQGWLVSDTIKYNSPPVFNYFNLFREHFKEKRESIELVSADLLSSKSKRSTLLNVSHFLHLSISNNIKSNTQATLKNAFIKEKTCIQSSSYFRHR